MPKIARQVKASNSRVLDYCGEIGAALSRAEVAVAALSRVQRDVQAGKASQDDAVAAFQVLDREVSQVALAMGSISDHQRVTRDLIRHQEQVSAVKRHGVTLASGVVGQA